MHLIVDWGMLQLYFERDIFFVPMNEESLKQDIHLMLSANQNPTKIFKDQPKL